MDTPGFLILNCIYFPTNKYYNFEDIRKEMMTNLQLSQESCEDVWRLQVLRGFGGGVYLRIIMIKVGSGGTKDLTVWKDQVITKFHEF